MAIGSTNKLTNKGAARRVTVHKRGIQGGDQIAPIPSICKPWVGSSNLPVGFRFGAQVRYAPPPSRKVDSDC